MNKPREWVIPLKTLIINDGKGKSAWLRQDREDETHVIEYAAFETMRTERDELKIALARIFSDAGKLTEERDTLRAQLDECLEWRQTAMEHGNND